MSVLTTRQRDLLKLLLESSEPRGTAELAAQLRLTPRQVNYDLKGLKRWLQRSGASFTTTPGVGIALQCTPVQQQKLAEELGSGSGFQLVLSAEQRQHLLALRLLTENDPFILRQLQQQTQVSRTTVLKDLEAVEAWIEDRGLTLARRTNYGIWVEGDEAGRRQAICYWLWGEGESGISLTQLTHGRGLSFSLALDRHLLPIVSQAYGLIRKWDTRKSASVVAHAEAQLGGRFSDDAVLFMSLAFAVQAERVQAGRLVAVDAQTLAWLQGLPVWAVAVQIADRLSWFWPASWPESEIAFVAMHLLASPRNERWPSDLDVDQTFSDLVTELMAYIETAYKFPGLSQDITLRDGLVNHVIPACLRQRFGLWMPALPPGATLSQAYQVEYGTARGLTSLIRARIGVVLPESEVDNLALLLRAAYVRERPRHARDVIVVCPAGMATAQLLVARLKARFPRLGEFRVVSMRALGQREIAGAHLIITTVPLPDAVPSGIDVIQVHPLLLPEDIERITEWMA